MARKAAVLVLVFLTSVGLFVPVAEAHWPFPPVGAGGMGRPIHPHATAGAGPLACADADGPAAGVPIKINPHLLRVDVDDTDVENAFESGWMFPAPDGGQVVAWAGPPNAAWRYVTMPLGIPARIHDTVADEPGAGLPAFAVALPHAIDAGTDNDREVAMGGSCQTYAIDNGPNGLSVPGPGILGDCTAAPFGTHDTDNSVAGTACPGAPLPPALTACIGADLNDPAPPAVAAGSAHPIGNDGVFDAAAGPLPCLGALTAGVGGNFRIGNACPVPAPFAPGIPPAMPPCGVAYTDTTGAQMPFTYLVCNDLKTDDGCTNVPVVVAPAGPGPGTHAPPVPGTVYDSLQECGWGREAAAWMGAPIPDDTGAPSGPPGPYFGYAVAWGGGPPTGFYCWPERLATTFGGTLWVPHSQCAPAPPFPAPCPVDAPLPRWYPDASYATGRDIEEILVFSDSPPGIVPPFANPPLGAGYYTVF